MITTDELTDRLARIVHEITATPVTPETDLLDAGLDSLACVELTYRVEQELGVACSLEDILGCETVADLARNLGSRLDPGEG
ncbi:MAG: acyl carrier protein [Knoellia sp.]